jgi:diaminopimelate decarboxylase
VEYTDWLGAKGLQYRGGSLHSGEESVAALADEFGTPLYITNEDIVRQRYAVLYQELTAHYPKIRIHYAVKANTGLAFLSIIRQLGGAADVVSPGETFLCKRAGFSPDRILYTGNNWTDEELRFALREGIMVNLDALSHIKRFARIVHEEGAAPPVVSFRINPSFGGGHHDHCITAGPDIKFGIFESQVVEGYALARDQGFERFGVHMHIGSGILEVEPFQRAMTKYFEIIGKIADLGLKLDFVDFGGGLGIPYRPDAEPLAVTDYAGALLSMFKEQATTLGLGEPVFAIEPGRYLSCESTILAVRVNTVKHNGFKTFVGVDAGFNTLIRPAFYGSHHEVVPVAQVPGREEAVVDVVGQLCESGDVLAKRRTIPLPEEGDLLAILDAGAYGFAMANRYNSRPLPAEVMIAEGHSPDLVRERETLEDLLLHQRVPDRLA